MELFFTIAGAVFALFGGYLNFKRDYENSSFFWALSAASWASASIF